MMPAYKAEDLRLPKKFAEQVLELEMEVEQSMFTVKQIQRLMALYSKAVEYYNGRSDGKYLYYQDKLQSLITQPKVLDMLNSIEKNDSEKIKMKEPSKADSKTKEELKKKERALKMNLHMHNKEIEKTDAKAEIIKNHKSMQNQESKIIESNLSQQSSNLQKRLEERRLKMKQKKDQNEPSSQHLTNSSTPNQPDSSQKQTPENLEKGESKSHSSGTASVEECTFKFNFDNLQDERFSDELMNRLKILQDGYDDNDYDNDDLFNEGAVEDEIEQILSKCDEEVEKILEEDRHQIETLYETIANEKFEKLAEIKAEYKYRIKFAPEEEQEALEKERDLELKETIEKFDKIKEEKVLGLKNKLKENKEKIKIKREGIKKVTNRVRRSVSRKASKRNHDQISPKKNMEEEVQPNFTNIMPLRNKQELAGDISKGINKNTEFSDSFKMPKGPVKISHVVRTPPNEQ